MKKNSIISPHYLIYNMKHSFTETILDILKKNFAELSEQVFYNSELIQYLNEKTLSAHKGSKTRGSFGNLYAIYVLVEDYIKNNFHISGDYSKYGGHSLKIFLQDSVNYHLVQNYKITH